MLPVIPLNTPTIVAQEPVQFELEVPVGASGGRILLRCADTQTRAQAGVAYVMEGVDLIRRRYEFEFWGQANAIVMVPESEFIPETRTWIIALVNIGVSGRIIEVIPQIFF